MFLPPFCPYPGCSSHREPLPRFFLRLGSYHPRCRSHPVPRFRCRICGRTFSRQTFRADYRQKKPYLNPAMLSLMVSCVGLRQTARCLKVARRTVEHRFRWLGTHAADFHRNRLWRARIRGPFQLDEMESFEGNRYQPVTIPILIQPESFFLVATAVGPLRRRGRLSLLQRRRRDAYESCHGRRPTRSRSAVREVLRTLFSVAAPSSPVILDSDEKPLYGSIGRSLFGRRFQWRRHSASRRRDRANPLFPINHTNARLRHYLARLRRRTWCVSKRREALQQHLSIAALWGNYCRGITNRTGTTPAQALGLARRAYRIEEVLTWREDWGPGRARAMAMAA